jgi:divalent metal cation (Fe/Co/Zn/Cd) transporter
MEKKYYTYVLALAIITIGYNILEGLISIWLGSRDETLALFGFGADSFIEVFSGMGILQMVLRIRSNPKAPRSKFEITALQITGWGFYLLTTGLVFGSILNIYQNHKPETTFWGIIISVISILVMFWLYKSKMYVGKKLNSDPVIADGRCTLVCIYMSIILLVSSTIYELTGFGWVDTIGALGLAWFSYKEGKEALEKAKGKACSCEHCSN